MKWHQAQLQYTKDIAERNIRLPRNQPAVIARAGPGRIRRTRWPVLNDRVVKNSLLSTPTQQTLWTDSYTRDQDHTPHQAELYLEKERPWAATRYRTCTRKTEPTTPPEGKVDQDSPRSALRHAATEKASRGWQDRLHVQYVVVVQKFTMR